MADVWAPIPIRSLPGIKRDGTRLEGDNYVDGQWCRFNRGLPRKIGGYRAINKYLTGLARTLHEYTQDTLTYIHAGSAEKIERFYIDGSFNTSVISDRTPLSGFTLDDNNIWQFDVISDLNGDLQLIAQVAPNLDCVCNSTGGELFYGDFFGTGALTPVAAMDLPSPYSATGGIVAVGPYAVAYGSGGFIMWSVPGDPSDYVGSGAGNAFVTGQKIIKGLPVRAGAGNSPGALLWSADSLLQMSYVGGTPTFQFDTLSSQSSIMSENCVIEYDGIYYWLGSDRFLAFNGVVRDIDNQLNRNFFFDGINYRYRQKIFAFKVPRWGEIWWCYPRGDSTEPDHAVIYNVREGTWYDTALPNGGRCSGLFPTVFRRPLMSGVEPQDFSLESATPNAGGTGYTAGDVLTVIGGAGTITAQLVVDTVGGSGEVTAVSVGNAGSYTLQPTNPVEVSGGTGADATFDLVFQTTYKFWVHEVGTNEVDGTTERPVPSWFETADLALPVTAQQNNWTQVVMLEPDFVQSGDMTVQVRGRSNARAPEVDGEVMTFPDTATTPSEEVVFLKTQRRELRFRFESNTINGNYELGLTLAHVQPGDGTVVA